MLLVPRYAPLVFRCSEVDELNSHGRGVASFQPLGLADRALDAQPVAVTRAVRKDRCPPPAAADRGPHPQRTEGPKHPRSQVTDLLGDPGGQAHKDPGISTPRLP